MKETDSRECRNCHSNAAMDFEHQKNADDAKRMKKGLDEGQTCIDCHKGIAHKLPDMSTGYKAIFADLEDASKSLSPAVGATLYTMTTKPFWLEKPKDESDTADGKLVAATPVEVVERDGDVAQSEVLGLAAGRRRARVLRCPGQAHLRRRVGS